MAFPGCAFRAARPSKISALPPITVSIGIAFFPEHGEETTKVIQAADQALYTAKEAGRDRFVFSAKKPGSAGGVGQGTRGGAE